jgi:hypothetical protein
MDEEVTREIHSRKHAHQAFDDVCHALAAVGRVKEAQQATLTVRGIMWPLMKWVKLEASVQPSEGGSLIRISAFSGDVNLTGQAGIGIERLIAAIEAQPG